MRAKSASGLASLKMAYRSSWPLGLLFASCMIIGPARAALPAALFGEDLPSLAPMLEQVLPAVVNISTSNTVQARENPLLNDPFFRRFFEFPTAPKRRRTQSLGSGVVIDAAKGLVVTNAHVIKNADEITVTLHDGRNFTAQIIGADKDSDVAVIKIPSQGLSEISLGTSSNLRVGDFVLAIGNPFGLNQTVTSGIVSALGRSGLGIEGYEDFIQTDASINPGNSGGALVNLRGELIGINTAILAPAGGNVGIGFAIPIDMARNLTQQLVEHGEVQRGFLGVYIQDLTPELAQAFGIQQRKGALIAQIVPGSPAERAGLREGDVVIEVNKRRVQNGSDLHNAIGLLTVGQVIKLRVVSGGNEKNLTARVVKAPKIQLRGAQLRDELAGAFFSPLPSDERNQGLAFGVWLEEVEKGSAAWSRGLRKDDVIVRVNRVRVENVDDFARRVVATRSLLFKLYRGGEAFLLTVR